MQLCAMHMSGNYEVSQRFADFGKVRNPSIT